MFLSNFPKVEYKLPSGYSYRINDFTRYVNIDKNSLSSNSFYNFYNIIEGERPDVVSTKLYGFPDYYWTFFLINDHLKNGYGSWPMSYSELETHVDYEYEGVCIQTTETFWEYNHINLGDVLILEENENVTGVVHSINKDFNQIVIKEYSSENESDWLISEGKTLVPLNYSSSTPRLTIQKATEYKYGISHYEDIDGNVIPVSYGINYNFSGETEGSIFNQEEILYPVTFLENEKKLNDQRFKIRVIRRNRISDFFERFKEVVNAN